MIALHLVASFDKITVKTTLKITVKFDIFGRGSTVSSVAVYSARGTGFDSRPGCPPSGSPSLNGYWSMTGNQPRRGKELATLLHYAVGLV